MMSLQELRERGHSSVLSDRLSVGTMVGLGLALLTILEFIVAVVPIPPVILWLTVIAVGKTWLILEFFMHVRQLRKEQAS